MIIRLIRVIAVIILLAACQESEQVSEFTGNETTYALQQASTFPVNGSVTFKERKDGATTIMVELSGTEGESKHPVHLHLGDLLTPNADVAALLSPVLGKSGKSETIIDQLADETKVSYTDLTKLNSCIKIHLSDVGAERDIILAGGNVGESSAKITTGGRSGIVACKSE